MAALHLLAAQTTQLARADNASLARPSLASATYPGLSSPVYPYQREAPHPLLSGPLRRGKWTPEEEEYAAAIIQHFLSGVLPIQYGTTLRGYIAQLLHCDPMRVSKKLIPGSVFVGVRIDPKIGRRSCPVDTPGLNEHKERAERHLAQLRGSFIESIEREEQEQAPSPPHSTGSPSTTTHVLSPLKRKRGDSDGVILYPRQDRNCEDLSRPPSLPSINELMRQHRLKAPSPSALHQFTQSATTSWHLDHSDPAINSQPTVDRHLPGLPSLRTVLYPSPA